MKVLIVDHHILFCEGLVSLLEKESDITVVEAVHSFVEVLDKVNLFKPDFVIMDLDWPDFSGLNLIQEIKLVRPETNVIVLTHHESDELVFTAIRNGARGYLLKDIPVSKLINSLRAIQKGEAAISRTMTYRILEEFSRLSSTYRHLTQTFSTDDLTKREQEILGLLSNGATNRQIASLLSISYSTVKIHIHHILHKLKLRSRSEVVNFVRRHR